CSFSSYFDHSLVHFLFFFFQAEDGIRHFHVTRVQPCALPILTKWSRSANSRSPTSARSRMLSPRSRFPPAGNCCWTTPCASARRSEERRVGEGWRGWGGAVAKKRHECKSHRRTKSSALGWRGR